MLLVLLLLHPHLLWLLPLWLLLLQALLLLLLPVAIILVQRGIPIPLTSFSANALAALGIWHQATGTRTTDKQRLPG
jgi:hypothetical protein